MTKDDEREEVDPLAEARESQKRDDEILSRAEGVFERMRTVRIENHWAEKINRHLRGAA